jgi:hypothetical protein
MTTKPDRRAEQVQHEVDERGMNEDNESRAS